MTREANLEKIERLERDLAVVCSEACRAETRRVIAYLKNKLAEQK